MYLSKKSTFITLLAVSVLFCILIAWQTLLADAFPSKLADLSSIETFCRFFALALMFSQSQLYKQRFYTSGIRISIGIIIIGVLFKIMHWPGYKEILLISLSVIPVLYFIWLIRKSKKSQLDLIKVVWVVVTYIGAILTLLHQLYGHEILQLSYFLFWVMFFDFIYVTYRKTEQA